MALSPLAGKPAPKETLIDPAQLEREYYGRKPEPAEPAQQISFGTSGHRGSPLTGSFNEATSWRSRRQFATTGADMASAARSTWAATRMQVLAANGLETPSNGAPIGGLKVIARSGWFAARPSGTENIYKIYAESFKDERHLEALLAEAQDIVSKSLEDR